MAFKIHLTWAELMRRVIWFKSDWQGLALIAVGILISAIVGSLSLDATHPVLTQAQTLFSIVAWRIVLNPYFYLITFVVLYLETVIPARKQQAVFSVGFWQDAVWLISDTVFRVLVLAVYLDTLQALLRYLPGIELLSLQGLPLIDQAAIAIICVDFFVWMSHVLRHRIPVLWSFHAVHHSQRELNLFSDLRFHVVDLLVGLSFAVVPLALLDVSLPTAATYIVLQRWYLRIYHANLKLNYGPLRYLLVTPQSHRVHHSIEPQHHDKNFGTLFSLWDFLWGTQYRDFHDYPATGIDDPDFPLEHKTHVWGLLQTYWAQTCYPFQQVYRQLMGQTAKPRGS